MFKSLLTRIYLLYYNLCISTLYTCIQFIVSDLPRPVSIAFGGLKPRNNHIREKKGTVTV